MPSFYEIFGNIFIVLSVFCAARNNPHTWPLGIIGCILYGFMFFDVKLYADVTLQIFFIITSIHGWILWRDHQSSPPVPVTNVARKQLLFNYIPLSALMAILYGGVLYFYTDASLPFIDSFVLTLSIAAQFLLMKRKVQSWYFWIAVDILSVGLYAYKDLYITSFVYFIFMLNAFYGLYNWKKIEQKS